MIGCMTTHNLARYEEDIQDAGSTFMTRSGERLAARLIRPDDAPLLIDLAYRLTPETRRRRFHQSMEHLSEKMVRERANYLADVDNYDTAPSED